MKWKQFSIGLAVALCAGIGIYLLVRFHQPASESGGEEENPPTVISVQVAALKRMTLHQYVQGYGSVEPAPAATNQPAGSAPLAPAIAGTIASVNVAEGQRVNKGDVLMELNSGTISAEYAQQELQRQQTLYEQHNTSLKSLQDAQAQVAALRVVAPIPGTITSLNAKPGQAVDVNTVVAQVVDLNRLAVTTDVPTSEANEMNVGDELQVLTHPPVAAAVSYISSTVDTNNDTVTVRARLPASSGLRPGQFLPLRIVVATRTNVLAVPAESVVTDVDGNSVIALVHGDKAIQTPVQTGFREDGWVEVSAPGLNAGDPVVTVGAYALPDKTQINIVNPSTNEVPAVSSSRPILQ